MWPANGYQLLLDFADTVLKSVEAGLNFLQRLVEQVA